MEGKGWVDAEDLQTGDRVRQADGTTGIVWLQWNVHKTHEMYNLTVDTAHTFFIGEGQWLVHNAGVCPIPKGIPADKPVVVVGEDMKNRVIPAAKQLSDAGYDVHTWPANNWRGGINCQVPGHGELFYLGEVSRHRELFWGFDL